MRRVRRKDRSGAHDPTADSGTLGSQQQPPRFRTIQVRPKDRLSLVPAGSTCGKPAAHRGTPLV
jgi:hypothetical protein